MWYYAYSYYYLCNLVFVLTPWWIEINSYYYLMFLFLYSTSILVLLIIMIMILIIYYYHHHHHLHCCWYPIPIHILQLVSRLEQYFIGIRPIFINQIELNCMVITSLFIGILGPNFSSLLLLWLFVVILLPSLYFSSWWWWSLLLSNKHSVPCDRWFVLLWS